MRYSSLPFLPYPIPPAIWRIIQWIIGRAIGQAILRTIRWGIRRPTWPTIRQATVQAICPIIRRAAGIVARRAIRQAIQRIARAIARSGIRRATCGATRQAIFLTIGRAIRQILYRIVWGVGCQCTNDNQRSRTPAGAANHSTRWLSPRHAESRPVACG
jgi:hypothetical protein